MPTSTSILHQNRDRDIRNIKRAKFQQILSIFNFGTNFGLTESKYFIKIIFDIKIEVGIFEISKIPNFKKILGTFNFGINLGRTGGKYLMKLIFDFKIETGIFEILNVPNFKKF